MPTLKPSIHTAVVAVAALVLVAGCNRPKPHAGAGAPGPLSASGEAGQAQAPAAPTVATSTEPLPPTPAWAQEYMGKTLADVLPTQSTDCVGNTDDVELRYQGPTPGVKVEGWGWDRAAKKPVEHILLADDHTGSVVGAGQTGKARPDVPKARPEVASPTTGWEAVTAKTTGGLYAYGMMGGKAVCRLGHINL